jgi:hypothetical protein
MTILEGNNVFFGRFAGKHICANLPYLHSIYINMGTVTNIVSVERDIITVLWMSGIKGDYTTEDLVIPGSKKHNDINHLIIARHNLKPGAEVQHRLSPRGTKKGRVIALDYNSDNVVVEWVDFARGIYKSEVLEPFSGKIDPNSLFRASRKTKMSFIPKFEMPKLPGSFKTWVEPDDDVPF